MDGEVYIYIYIIEDSINALFSNNEYYPSTELRKGGCIFFLIIII